MKVQGGAPIQVVVVDPNTHEVLGGAATKIICLGFNDPNGIVQLPALQVGDVSGGNYAYIMSNGFLQFFGDSRPWIDWNFDGASFAPGASAPDLIQWNSTKIRVRAFDGANTQEELSKVIEANHNWAEGTVLKTHVHWGPTTAAAGNVQWFLDWFAIEGSDYTGIATVNVIQAAGGVAWNEQFAEFPDITLPSNYLLGTQIGFALYRVPGVGNPNDTYGADAAILTVGVHARLNSLGSCQVAEKDCAG